MSEYPKISRRSFVRSAAHMGLVLSASVPLVRAASPNGKLQHAAIGVGGMQGGSDLGNFLQHDRLNMAVLCDVDAGHMNKAAESAAGARQYADWREMLAKEGDRIDSVSITVPDHMHASIAMSALRAGRHVYCQKPLCHRVAQVRALVKEAGARSRQVTQLGTQIASSVGNRLAIDLIRSGVIGKVRRVVMNSNRPADAYRVTGPRPAEENPVPASINWDHWLGVAPVRPYHAESYHPVRWRSWQDFGTGWLGDMGCHIFHVPWRALELTAPLKCRADVQESWAQSPERRNETWPQAQHITWVFPGNERTQGPELQVEWFDGAMEVPDEIRAINESPNYPLQAAMVVGTEGSLLLPHTRAPLLFPGERFKGRSFSQPSHRNHYHHFAGACLGGEATESDFLKTGPMNEAILLGATVAVHHPGRWLEWDAGAMRVTNVPEANGRLQASYRQGWHVEGLG